MCTTEQMPAARSGTIEGVAGASVGRIKTMLFGLAILIAVGGALIHRARAAGRANQANLGSMSAQWLAEHRAAHPS
jgi:hypothetical protein